MEYQDNLIAGIPPGGVRDPSTVKIMICYLLQRLDRPVSESELVELLTGDQTVNYFLLTTALSGLKKLGHLRQKGDSLLLTQLGRRTAEELGGELPVTLRERVLARAETLRRENRLHSETSAEIVGTEDGYRVDFSFHDGEIEFMKLSLYAPDEVQAVCGSGCWRITSSCTSTLSTGSPDNRYILIKQRIYCLRQDPCRRCFL